MACGGVLREPPFGEISGLQGFSDRIMQRIINPGFRPGFAGSGSRPAEAGHYRKGVAIVRSADAT